MTGFRFRRKFLPVAVMFFAAAAVFAVETEKLADLLPRHSAIAAGADFAALCTHPQSAAAFSVLAAQTEKYQVSLGNILYSSDSRCRRSSSLLEFSGSQDVAKIRQVSGVNERNIQERSNGITVYCVNGKPGDRHLLRAAQLDDRVIGLYMDYPRKEAFALDCRGAGEKLRRHIPARKVLFWSAGYPEFPGEPLAALRFFETFLENDIDGNLLFHGKVICRNAQDAATAEMFFPLALAVVLKRNFDISPVKTLRAVSGLKIIRKENVLNFYCTDLSAALEVVSGVVADKLRFPEGGGNEQKK